MLREQIVGGATPEEHQHQDHHGEGDHDQRRADVQGLAAQERAVLLDPVDLVEGSPRGPEPARGAVQRPGDATDQGAADRSSGGVHGRDERGSDGAGQRWVEPLARQVVDYVGHRAVLAQGAQQGHGQQQRGEQRQHRVVGETGGAVAHVVGLEGLEGPHGGPICERSSHYWG